MALYTYGQFSEGYVVRIASHICNSDKVLEVLIGVWQAVK